MNRILLHIIIIFITGCSFQHINGDLPPFDPYTYPEEINTGDVTETGNIFYVDPAAGSITNDGSSDHPWSTLEEVIENGFIETRDFKDKPAVEGSELVVVNPGAPVRSGDTIVLRNGFHGRLEISGAYNEDYITIMADDGNHPQFSSVFIRSSEKWKISGLYVSPSFAPVYANDTLISLESHNWQGPLRNITIDNCTAYSVTDTAAWSMDDWNSLSCNGINAYGENITIRNNYFKNVNFGIAVVGKFALVKGNTVENFAGDGMRGIGNDMFFEYNTVKNCYAVNANHDDGFQSWSLKQYNEPPRERVVLRGNIIINNVDPAQPFKGTLQGIGCFDGPFVDWVIENNIIIVDHWHGISLYEGHNCRIENNTVVDINGITPGPSWIMITDHKDGTPSSECLIRNNIANSISAGNGVTEDHNYKISYSQYSDIFVSPADFDFHLKPGTAVIDTGSAGLIPPYDRDGNARVSGSSVDLGAYEYIQQ